MSPSPSQRPLSWRIRKRSVLIQRCAGRAAANGRRRRRRRRAPPRQSPVMSVTTSALHRLVRGGPADQRRVPTARSNRATLRWKWRRRVSSCDCRFALRLVRSSRPQGRLRRLEPVVSCRPAGARTYTQPVLRRRERVLVRDVDPRDARVVGGERKRRGCDPAVGERCGQAWLTGASGLRRVGPAETASSGVSGSGADGVSARAGWTGPGSCDLRAYAARNSHHPPTQAPDAPSPPATPCLPRRQWLPAARTAPLRGRLTRRLTRIAATPPTPPRRTPRRARRGGRAPDRCPVTSR